MEHPYRCAVFLLCTTILAVPVQADLSNLLRSAQEQLGSDAAGALPAGEVAGGLKEALSQGARFAVDRLGRPNGFYGDPKVRIEVPGMLDTVTKGLRAAGQDEIVDEFELSMNRAAEAAAPAALDVVEAGIANLTFEDAKRILNGPDDAATQYLRRVGGDRIESRMRPIVSKATSSVGVTQRYKSMVDQAGYLTALVDTDSLDLDGYVTEKATDGVFAMIAREEKRIRTNPAARSTELLKRVFQ
jgi:hypothetical protein